MNRAYKYRLYPNKAQQTLLNKTMGSCRFYWNNLVATFNSYDKENNPNPQFKTQKKLKEEYEWLSEVSAAALQQKMQDFREFQKQLFSKNRKKSIGRPNFKKKSNRQSYRLPNQKFKVLEDKIQLEKIGKVKMVIDRPIPEDAKFVLVTVSKNCAGQYFVSICVETHINQKNKTNETVGIDLGLKEFATLSDGVVVANPRYFRENQSKLKRMQQHLSRKQKGSKRKEKCRLKVAKIHNDIANQRSNFLHNTTSMLVNNYDIISIEDLNVKGMMANHKLAKSIADVSFHEFRRQLEYKCLWYGKELVVIGRFEPTSKTCSCCGWKNDNLTLKDRTFSCKGCGLEIDRDLNAAYNIKRLGVESLNERREGCYKLDEAFKMN